MPRLIMVFRHKLHATRDSRPLRAADRTHVLLVHGVGSIRMEEQLRAIPNLFADPVRAFGEPPFYSSNLARRAEPFWHECSTARVSRIPNEIHQPWLHGTTPKWEHVLGMLSAKFIVQPAKYTLYYDKWPQRVSPQWACFCAIASCVQRQPSTGVPLRRGRRVKMGHWPELMRYDVLLEHGVSRASLSSLHRAQCSR